MKVEDVVLGTTYRIKDWDSMLAESSLDADGHINPVDSTDSFCVAMQHLCGTLYTPGGHYCATRHEGFTPATAEGWYISAYMLEPLESGEQN